MNKKRYIMELMTSSEFPNADVKVRHLTDEDIGTLGNLLFTADQGTVDDEGLPLENSIKEVEDTFNGKYGPFLNNCSFGVLKEDSIVAAVLVTFYKKDDLPLIAFTMTHPKYKGQGLCPHLLRMTSWALNKAGYKKCFLAVNSENVAAVSAYQKVGFTS